MLRRHNDQNKNGVQHLRRLEKVLSVLWRRRPFLPPKFRLKDTEKILRRSCSSLKPVFCSKACQDCSNRAERTAREEVQLLCFVDKTREWRHRPSLPDHFAPGERSFSKKSNRSWPKGEEIFKDWSLTMIVRDILAPSSSFCFDYEWTWWGRFVCFDLGDLKKFSIGFKLVCKSH